MKVHPLKAAVLGGIASLFLAMLAVCALAPPAKAATAQMQAQSVTACPGTAVQTPQQGEVNVVADPKGNLCGGSSGGGGAVTAAAGSYADGALTTQGLEADAACGTDNGSCTTQALLKRLNQRITSLIAALGTPIQTTGGTVQLVAGSALAGKFGIDQTTPGTTNGVQINAAIAAGGNDIGIVDTGVAFSGDLSCCSTAIVHGANAPWSATPKIITNVGGSNFTDQVDVADTPSTGKGVGAAGHVDGDLNGATFGYVQELGELRDRQVSATNTALTATYDLRNLHDTLAISMVGSAGTCTVTISSSPDNSNFITIDSLSAALTVIKQYTAATVGAGVALSPLSFRYVKIVVGACGAGDTSTLIVGAK